MINMTSPELLMNRGRNKYRPLNSRASSATLFLGQHVPDNFDGPADRTDMIIAQGLLQKDSPQITRPQSPCHSGEDAQQCYAIEGNEIAKKRRLRQGQSSNTWTSSSGAASDEDGNDDRTPFVEEYNRLAKKYGVQPILPEEFVTVDIDKVTLVAKQGSWIMRKLLRRTSSIQTTIQTEKQLRHKRSVSDLSIRLRAKKDALKDKSLLELVRLCGTSALYLPAEYAASTLSVPTCFRATAQYLVQHAASSRGIFRIPGSHSTINALYNHYASQDDDGDLIRGTVRCPTLPDHINCSVHDVASAFKKFLAGLPGGILGKVWIFESTISIYSHLDAVAEHTRTKQSKVRARLIALAVASIASRHQRELISAVFGLLSMIGRAAETAQREDEHGRPLPTSDLMGYGALGVVFGPLLIGDLLDGYDLRPAGPHGCFSLTQQVRSRPGKTKHKKNKGNDEPVTARQGAEKIRIVNNITEMLITHWRDVVRHMKNLGALGSFRESRSYTRRDGRAPLRPSASESFAIRKPPDWDAEKISVRHIEGDHSPTPSSRKGLSKLSTDDLGQQDISAEGALFVRKRRLKPISGQMIPFSKSMNVLSPTVEEVQAEEGREFFTPAAGANQLKVASREYDDVRPSPSTHTIYAGLSKATTISNLKTPVVAVESSPQLIQNDSVHSVSAILSEVISLTTRSKHNEYPNTQPAIQEQSQTRALVEQDAIALEIRDYSGHDSVGSPTIKRVKQISKRQNAAVSFHRNPEQDAQFRRGVPALVPTGIVSSRLRGIKASGARDEPPSGLRMLLDAENIRASQYQNQQITWPRYSQGSHSPQSLSKDPLSKISHEEDVASLASLAEVMHSEVDAGNQGSPLYSNVTPQSASSSSPHIPRLESAVSNQVPSEFLDRDHPQGVVDVNKFIVQVSPGRRTTSPGTRQRINRTTRRSATESKVMGPRATSSVKALAARFDADASPPPSLATTPEMQRVPRSQFESGVISPYTMNRSPVQRDHKLNKSDHSWRVSHRSVSIELFTPSKLQGRASPPVSMHPLSNSPRKDELKPPQWPKLRPVTQTPPRGKSACASSPFQARSNLHRLGDGNVSFIISRKPSLAFSRTSNHTPLVESHSAKKLTPRKIRSTSPLDISPFSLGQGNLSSEKSTQLRSLPRARNRSANLLYAQMRQLQNQLKTKTDEADDLRRQLTAQRSLKASCELGEQLRRTKRELENWRKRAEMAEKRLEVQSHRAQFDTRRHAAEDQTAVNFVVSKGKSAHEDEKVFVSLMREIPYEAGKPNEHQRSESQGTVRRESPNRAARSSSEMDGFSEAKDHISNTSMRDTSSWPFELE